MAKPNTNKTKRLLAERMFIEEGMTAKDISDQLDISVQSLSKWRKEDDWDRTRDEIVAAPHKLRDILMRELKLVAEGKKSVVDADALSKINKVLEGVSSRISVQVIFSVFKEFDNWMADQDAKTAVHFTEWHKQFLLFKINQEG